MEKQDSYIRYNHNQVSSEEQLAQSKSLCDSLVKRRSIRAFSDEPVDRAIIEHIIMTAGSAPSGANKQPWTFCAISDPAIKKQIRDAAEKEEYQNYHGRMSDDWLDDLKKFGTDWNKPFIEDAPWLIVMFKKLYDLSEQGEKQKNYYVSESVGIAAGFLISAIHNAGLVTLTHTPSPMNFLEKILKRPENEKAYLLLPVGLPKPGVQVPVITKKSLDEIAKFY